MEMENLTFPEAVRALGREVGIEIAETESGERGESERCYAANAVAQARYREALRRLPAIRAPPISPSAGIDAEIIERFGLGFAPDRWDTVVQALRGGAHPRRRTARRRDCCRSGAPGGTTIGCAVA